MSIADTAIAALDAGLAQAGQDIVLRRAGAADITCRASVRTYRLREEDIVGGVAASELLVFLSHTEILAAGWPGITTAGETVDPSIPRRNDKVIIDGRVRNVNAVTAISIGNQVVRVELSVT